MFQTRQKDIQKVSCKGQRLTRGPVKSFFPSFKFRFAIHLAFFFQNRSVQARSDPFQKAETSKNLQLCATSTFHHDKQNSGRFWLISRHSIHTFPPKKTLKGLKWLGVARHYAMMPCVCKAPRFHFRLWCLRRLHGYLWNSTVESNP